MFVLVTGGRAFTDRAYVFRTLDALHARHPIEMIVHGACGLDMAEAFDWTQIKGADRLAHEWARSTEVMVTPFPARWGELGRGAGPVRNQAMVEYVARKQRLEGGQIVGAACVAFPGSRGTGDCVNRARKAHIKVIFFAG
jgi:SLOG family YspA-like protein